MTSTETDVLVFQDQVGNYFVVPRETLEQGRVPEEHKAEVEQLIAEQEDVQGYQYAQGYGWVCGYTVRNVFGTWCIQATYPPGVRTDEAR